MIIGDLKVHNPLWIKVKDILSNINLCILNDGSNLFLHPGIGTYSSINFTLVTFVCT